MGVLKATLFLVNLAPHVEQGPERSAARGERRASLVREVRTGPVRDESFDPMFAEKMPGAVRETARRAKRHDRPSYTIC